MGSGDEAKSGERISGSRERAAEHTQREIKEKEIRIHHLAAQREACPRRTAAGARFVRPEKTQSQTSPIARTIAKTIDVFMALLKIDKLTMRFGGLCAVGDLDLERAGRLDKFGDWAERGRQNHGVQCRHRHLCPHLGRNRIRRAPTPPTFYLEDRAAMRSRGSIVELGRVAGERRCQCALACGDYSQSARSECSFFLRGCAARLPRVYVRAHVGRASRYRSEMGCRAVESVGTRLGRR